MMILFKDGSKETFFVWVSDTIQITVAKNTNEAQAEAYKINSANSKRAINFFDK